VPRRRCWWHIAAATRELEAELARLYGAGGDDGAGEGDNGSGGEGPGGSDGAGAGPRAAGAAGVRRTSVCDGGVWGCTSLEYLLQNPSIKALSAAETPDGLHAHADWATTARLLAPAAHAAHAAPPALLAPPSLLARRAAAAPRLEARSALFCDADGAPLCFLMAAGAQSSAEPRTEAAAKTGAERTAAAAFAAHGEAASPWAGLAEAVPELAEMVGGALARMRAAAAALAAHRTAATLALQQRFLCAPRPPSLTRRTPLRSPCGPPLRTARPPRWVCSSASCARPSSPAAALA
jgi:hypothetical protein